MTTPRKPPVKRAPAKRTQASRKKYADPGDPSFDWGQIYTRDVKLFRFMSEDGFVVCLPRYNEPAEGEIFGLMLLNKSEQDLLIYVMRQHIKANAIDPDGALLVTFEALKKMSSPGTIEGLLKAWPEEAGFDLGKL